MRKIAVCIPTYKNRYKNCIISRLNEIDNKYDILLFLSSEEDYTESEYDKYDMPSNVKFIITNMPTIYKKRQYILDYTIEHGYNAIFQLDDDILEFWKITEESKRTTSNSYRCLKTTANDAFNMLENRSNEYNATLASIIYSFGLGFQKPGNVNLNASLQMVQVTYLDLDKFKDAGVSYDTSGNVCEDADLAIQLIYKGHNVITNTDYGFSNPNNSLYNSTICNIDEFDHYKYNMFLKYPEIVTLRVNKKGWLANTIHYKRINDGKTHKYDENLYNICKTKDVNKIKEYILSKKNKK